MDGMIPYEPKQHICIIRKQDRNVYRIRHILSKKGIRIEHDCFSRSTSDSLLICPKTPVRTRHYIQVLNYAALKLNQISRKQLDPVQFDGEMCLWRYPFLIYSPIPDACPWLQVAPWPRLSLEKSCGPRSAGHLVRSTSRKAVKFLVTRKRSAERLPEHWAELIWPYLKKLLSVRKIRDA